jgi:hypothetical protein
MKRWVWTVAMAAALALTGCSAQGVHSAPSLAPDGRASTDGMASPSAGLDPAASQEVMPAMREYFHYRKKAIIAGDAGVLWNRYPALQQGGDPGRGINAEAQEVQAYRSRNLIDGDVDLEHYARVSGQIAGETAEITVHGLELYLTDDFGHTGGEFIITLFLRKQDGRWTVVKTDAVTLAELHTKP